MRYVFAIAVAVILAGCSFTSRTECHAKYEIDPQGAVRATEIVCVESGGVTRGQGL